MSNEDNKEKKSNGFEAIGQKLHDARVAKGDTIDDLQKKTKIQKRYLIAIEEGDFNSLPGDFYVRAFVKQYADAVGLDGIDLLKNFDNDLPDTQNPAYVNKVSEDKLASRSAQRKVDDRYQAIRRYIPVAIVSVIVLIVIIVIWVAAARNHKNTSQTDIHQSSVSVSSDKEASKKVSESEASSRSSESVKKAAKKKSTKTSTTSTTIKKDTSDSSGDTFEVNTKASGSTIKLSGAWFQVDENGSTSYTGTIASGSSHTLKLSSTTKTVQIMMGNAIKTSVLVNGQKVPYATSVSSKTVTLKFK